ncbi:MAG: outer membrane protein [Sulfurimonas sp.]|jgi:outer membrane protein
MITLFFTTFLHGEYLRSIKVGSFVSESKAQSELKKLNKFVEKHTKIADLQKAWDFTFKYRKSGSHYVITTQPLRDRAVVQEIIDTLRLSYPDAYVTRLNTATPFIKKEAPSIILEKDEVEEIPALKIEKTEVGEEKESLEYNFDEKKMSTHTVVTIQKNVSEVNDLNLTINVEDINKIIFYFTKRENKVFKPVPVTLNNLIQESVKRNSNIIIQKIQADISRKKIEYEKGILDPILSFSALKSQSHVPNDAIDASIQLKSEYEDDISVYDVGIGGLSSIGTKWDISFSQQSKWSTYIEQSYPNEYSNKLDLSLKQPLLKGFGSKNTLIKIDMAKISSLIAQSEYKKQTMDLIGTVIQLYWKLYGTYKLYLSWENSLGIANEQLVKIKSGLKYGTRSNLELFSAQKSVSLRKVQLYNTKTSIFDIQNKILNLLSLSSSNNDNILFIPIDTASIDKITIPEFRVSYEAAVTNWPELEILEKKLHISKLQVEYAEDQLLPQLDFTFGVNKRSLNIDSHDARKDLIDEDFTSWSSGLELTIPIFNDYAKQSHEMEKLKYLQSSLELNQLKRTLDNGLHSKIINLKNNKISYYEYLNGILFQDKLVNIEYERLNLGMSSIIEVFEQQENLIQYKRKLFNNLVDLKLSEASLQKATGVLLDRFSIQLDNQIKYEIAKDAQYGNQ